MVDGSNRTRPGTDPPSAWLAPATISARLRRPGAPLLRAALR